MIASEFLEKDVYVAKVLLSEQNLAITKDIRNAFNKLVTKQYQSPLVPIELCVANHIKPPYRENKNEDIYTLGIATKTGKTTNYWIRFPHEPLNLIELLTTKDLLFLAVSDEPRILCIKTTEADTPYYGPIIHCFDPQLSIKLTNNNQFRKNLENNPTPQRWAFPNTQSYKRKKRQNPYSKKKNAAKKYRTI